MTGKDHSGYTDRGSKVRSVASEPSTGGFLNRDVALILIAQSAFGFGWSLYLLAPKFQTVVLGAGPETIGLTGAVAGIAGVMVVPFAATGIDRLGRKLFFRIGCALVTLLSIGYMFVDHVGVLLFALQGLVAMAFVLAFNASAALMADWAPHARLGQAIGWLGAANVCMNAVATAVAEPLADTHGWHVVFALGIASSLIAFALSFALRDAPLCPVSDPAPQPPLPLAISEAPAPEPAPSEIRAPSTIQRPMLTRCLVVAVLAGSVFSAVFTFIQPFALSRGAHEVRLFFIGFTVAAVACRVLFGGLGDRHGRRRVSLGAVVLYALAALLCAWLDPNLLWMYGAVFGTAHGVLYPTLNALVLETVPASRRGLGMALYNGAFNVGMAAGGLGWGLLAKHYGYPVLFFSASVLALFAVIPLVSEGNVSRPVRPESL